MLKRNLQTPKVKCIVFKNKIIISDRMPLNVKNILLFLLLTFIVTVSILGIVGVLYTIVFSIGYILFQFMAWIYWIQIEINLIKNQMIIFKRILDRSKKTKVVISNFRREDLILNEFQQSGMTRAMLQYHGHKITDLMLLTHSKDIELVKQILFKDD